MKRQGRRILAIVVSLLTGVTLVASITLLVTDWLGARERLPAEKERLDELELAVREDAAQAELLTAEYVRQRDATLERRERTDVYTVCLIVSAVLFLASTKRLVGRGAPLPTEEQIRFHRADSIVHAAAPRGGRGGGAGAESPPPAPGIDLSFVDLVVKEEGTSKEAAIAILQRIQSHYRYLPDEALLRVCELTEISPAQITGVSTFYAQFRRSPVGKYVVKVCHGTACHVAGAGEINDELRRHLQIAPEADTDPQRVFTLDEVACVGCCSLAPVLMIEDETVGGLSPSRACEALESYRRERDT